MQLNAKSSSWRGAEDATERRAEGEGLEQREEAGVELRWGRTPEELNCGEGQRRPHGFHGHSKPLWEIIATGSV